MNVFELAGQVTLTGQDKVNKELSGLEERMGKASKALKAGGAAVTAVGAAGMMTVARSKKLNAELASTGLVVGQTADEMREHAIEITNVTFPLESVKNTFAVLASEGIKDTEVLKQVAVAFDGLADATGSSAEEVSSQLIPVFKAFGMEMPTTLEDLDKFTWLTKNAGADLGDFAGTIGRLAPKMEEAGISFEDAHKAIAILSQKGLKGADATGALTKMMSDTKNAGKSLADMIGYTREQEEWYAEETKNATGVTQLQADVMGGQYTIVDKLKHGFDVLALKTGSLLEPLEPMLAIMTALGPAMIFLGSQAGINTVMFIKNTAAKVAHNVATARGTIATWAHVVAQKALNKAFWMNPWGLVVAGIMLLIGAGVLLVKNWDTVKEWFSKFWGWLKDNWAKALLFVAPFLGLPALIIENWDGIKSFFSSLWDSLKSGISGLPDILMKPFRLYFSFLEKGFNWLIEQLNKIKVVFPSWLNKVPGLQHWAGKTFGVNLPKFTLPSFLTGMAQGGMITQPTLLSRLSDLKPYAIAGEAGAERVTPVKAGQMMTVVVEMDGHQLASAVMPYAVGEIRLRTGLKI